MSASNIAVTPGSGATVLTDLVGSNQVQVVKLDNGAAGTSAPVNSSNPLPVSLPATQAGGVALGQGLMAASVPVALASNQSSIPVAATLQAGAAKVGVVTTDQTTHGTTDLVAADITKVNGAAVAVGHGTAAASLRVELPTDGTGVVGLNAGANVVGKTTTDLTTPGTTNQIAARTNAYRNSGTLHRSAINSIDKLGTVGTITLSGGTGGSLVSATTYYVSAAAYNRWGNAIPASVVNATPGGSNTAINAAFAQVTNADGYDIFLSTDVGAPKWVGRITEAQRASGIVISAVGVTSAGGTAGGVLINVVGTGVQTTSNPYAFNNAYTPAVVAGVNSVNCAGYQSATVHYKIAVTDLRSLPSFTPAIFFQDQTSNTDWFYDPYQSQPLNLLTGDAQPLEQSVIYQVNGATAMVVLGSQLGGQGATFSAWVELA